MNISPTTFAKVLDSASEDEQDNEEMEVRAHGPLAALSAARRRLG